MKGIERSTAQVAHKDKRRVIIPICNGNFTARQIKVIKAKKGSILGNHCHKYREIRYLLKGRAKYVFENLATGEKESFMMEKGEIMITDPWIVHAAEFLENSIMIEGTEEQYISADHNDIKKVILE